MKLARGLHHLRTVLTRRTITDCIRNAQRSSFRIVHYSIQSNHLHLIIEADDRNAMSSGMKGFGRRLVCALNKLWQRRGPVFPKRFHDRVLRSLHQVRNALRYVLNNHLKHGERPRSDRTGLAPDPYSSGRYFDGWRGRAPDLDPQAEGAVIALPCWKIRCGWKRHHAAIGLDELPVSAPARG